MPMLFVYFLFSLNCDCLNSQDHLVLLDQTHGQIWWGGRWYKYQLDFQTKGKMIDKTQPQILHTGFPLMGTPWPQYWPWPLGPFEPRRKYWTNGLRMPWNSYTPRNDSNERVMAINEFPSLFPLFLLTQDKISRTDFMHTRDFLSLKTHYLWNS